MRAYERDDVKIPKRYKKCQLSNWKKRVSLY